MTQAKVDTNLLKLEYTRTIFSATFKLKCKNEFKKDMHEKE